MQRFLQFLRKVVGSRAGDGLGKREPSKPDFGGLPAFAPVGQPPVPRGAADQVATFAAETANRSLDRPVVFEPALLHTKAFRAGEPRFADGEAARRYWETRSRVLHHILSTINETEAVEHLVLRGSAVLVAWFKDRARRPGDLDWVVAPSDWKMHETRSDRLIDRVVAALRGTPIDNGLRIPDLEFARSEIWTYEKAPGLRIIIPWSGPVPAEDGTVQMDFVFGEAVQDPPVVTELRLSDLPPINVRTSSRVQSLAWKLAWLLCDMHPLGKDLYDAVLLAESTPLTWNHFAHTVRILEPNLENVRRWLRPDAIRGWKTEWEDFQKEYPEVTGDESAWLERLVKALEPLWQEMRHLKS